MDGLKRYELSISKSLNTGKIVKAKVKENLSGEFVKYDDVTVKLKEHELLCNEIAVLLRKIHGFKEDPNFDIHVWTREYNRTRLRIENQAREALKKVGIK